MSKFLDEYGVARMWSNTKNYVDGHSGGSGGGVTATLRMRLG